MMIRSIRGATTVKEDKKEEILEVTKEMLEKIMIQNEVEIDDIISVQFTATNDITEIYPAVSAREIGIVNAGLMCMQEMYVKNSLRKCIRVLLTVRSTKEQREIQHIYMRGARMLRPDITGEEKMRAIAIDGPCGSGKSTIARRLAKEIGCIYVDTGAMYRTTALYYIRRGINLNDEAGIIKELDNIIIDIKYVEGEQRIFLDEEDVTEKIREQQIANASSKVAIINEVREKLVKMQKEIARRNSVVMDGRDIGTCVLPEANLKIYLEARADVRAERRKKELENLGKEVEEIEKLKKEIEERDEQDKNREISPLRKAEDAIYLDCSDMSINEVEKFILDLFYNNL